MPKFFEGYIGQLLVPAGKVTKSGKPVRDVRAFDSSLPGFGILKSDTGRAVYFVKFNVGAQQRKLTLGPVVDGNLAKMRGRAADVLAKARLRQDVVAEHREAAAKAEAEANRQTLGQLVSAYLASREGSLRASSRAANELYLKQHWRPLHSRFADDVSRRDVVAVLDEIERDRGKVAADRARSALSGFFMWCIDRGHVSATPVVHLRSRNTNRSRERVLSEREVREVWRACGDDDYSRIIKLLLMTGQRKSEISGLSWNEFNFAERQIELPGARTKNGRPHVVPLSDAALALLPQRVGGRDMLFGRGNNGFSGWSRAKRLLDVRIEAARTAEGEMTSFPQWCVHDIRRTFVTFANELGLAAPAVIESAVNHITGRTGVAGVYDRSKHAGEKRRLMKARAERVAEIVG